jgi:predicted Kef-type K+ transport protein
MHENFELILTLTGGMTAAVLFGYVAHRFGLPPSWVI